jgi:hypothetical protein
MNAFFWSAFIIYDDFWDEDKDAQPKLLPLANVMSRYFSSFFYTYFNTKNEYTNYFHEMMNNLDGANFFEITNCRFNVASCKKAGDLPEPLNFGDMKTKFYPCFGHVFGPIAILSELGYTQKSKEVKTTILFFKNYLIARQLSDDLHDFEEDFYRGHISLVVNELIKDLKKEGDSFPINRANIQTKFWTETIERLAKTTEIRINSAIKLLNNIQIIKDKTKLEDLCLSIKKSMMAALEEKNNNFNLIKKLTNK